MSKEDLSEPAIGEHKHHSKLPSVGTTAEATAKVPRWAEQSLSPEHVRNLSKLLYNVIFTRSSIDIDWSAQQLATAAGVSETRPDSLSGRWLVNAFCSGTGLDGVPLVEWIDTVSRDTAQNVLEVLPPVDPKLMRWQRQVGLRPLGYSARRVLRRGVNAAINDHRDLIAYAERSDRYLPKLAAKD